MNRPASLGLGLLLGCQFLGAPTLQAQTPTPKATPQTIAFHPLDGHRMLVPVRINDKLDAQFVLDTGIGITLVSSKIAKDLGIQTTREYSGRRAGGQSMTVPVGHILSLSLGSQRDENLEVGVSDLKGMLPDSPEFAKVDGILSLTFFRNRPFTIDYTRGTIVLETHDSLEQRRDVGKFVKCTVEDDRAAAVLAFLPLQLPKSTANQALDGLLNPNGSHLSGGSKGGGHGGSGHVSPGGGETQMDTTADPTALAGIDTGNEPIVLNSKFMDQFDVDPTSSTVKAIDGKDQNGNSYRRYSTKLPGTIGLSENKDIDQRHPEVIFQKSSQDGSVGSSFLSQYLVTIDLHHAEIIFRR